MDTPKDVPSDVPPEMVEHSYANPSKKESSSDSSSSEDSSSSSDAEQTTDIIGNETTTSGIGNDIKLEPRTRVPPKRHVDTYTSLTPGPKTPPVEKIRPPKRLSTSVSRKAKEPLRQRRRSEGLAESISRSLRKKKSLETMKLAALPIKLRTNACGQCEGCRRDDCGKCVYCLDKVKFGGPGKKKQKCLLRACEERPPKHKLVNIASLQKKTTKASPKASSTSTPKASSTSTPKASSPSTPKKSSLKKTISDTPTSSSLVDTNATTATESAKTTTPSTPQKQASASLKEIVSGTPTSSSLADTNSTTTKPANTTAPPIPIISTSTALNNLARVVRSIASKANPSGSTSVTASPAGAPKTTSSLPKDSPSSIKLSTPVIKSTIPLPMTVGTALTIATSNIAKALKANSASGVKVNADTLAGKMFTTFKTSTPVAENKEKDAPPKSAPTVDKGLAAVETGEPGILKRTSPRVIVQSIKPGALQENWDMKMKCQQCGREKSLSMARTDRFCTRRCVIQWLEEHPDKTPKDAVGDSSAPLFSLPSQTPPVSTPDSSKAKDSAKSSKALPRVLKQLEIDMAPPGTRLHISGDSAGEEDKAKITPTNDDSLPKDSDSSKRTRFSQPATSSAKRSVVTPQPPAIKKAKNVDKVRTASPSNTSKSVKFDLNSNSVSSVVTTPPPVSFTQSSGLPSSISIVPLDRLTEFVKEQQKKFAGNNTPTRTDVKLPKGLTQYVQDWSVADVSTYFQGTRDCAEFGSIFKEQEVDGFALLKLTDQTMYRCLGLPLGKVVKVMAHINELKKLAAE